MSSRRLLTPGLRQVVRTVLDEAAHAGNGPSTSYSSMCGQSARYWREVGGLAGHSGNARIVGRGLASRALRREADTFLREWRGFKTVAVGSGIGTVQHSQGYLTALLPPALLWLLCVLPTSYRAFLLRLWGMDPGYGKHPYGCQSYSASEGSATSPVAAAVSWVLSKLHLTSFVAMLLDELALVARATYLCMLFLPALLMGPLAGVMGDRGRGVWLRLVQWALENAGPAFIKWGQWASTRPDLFPEDLCLRLEQLQSSAPAHAPALTLAAVERAFSAPISDLFDAFEEQPLASGSIAQVHVATLSDRGAALVGGGAVAGNTVAVKVRHPGVSGIMHRDFILMQRAAALCSALPALAELRLEESIRQFGGPLKEQLDLSVEASHLQRFNSNFRAWSHIRFPVPLYPLVSPDVLVESYEEGDLIMRYVRSPHRHNAFLAQTGVDVFLTMMLRDNFIHADLHPGNLLVKPADPPTPLVAGLASLLPASWSRTRSWLLDRAPQIVMLDTGMIVELSKEDQSALLGFFKALTRMEGRRLAKEIVRMSVDGTCKDQVAFGAELEGMFASMDREYLRLNSQAVIRDVIERMRQHKVTLRSSVSTVVVTSLVLEGWSSQLDPEVRILETMAGMLGDDTWAERLGAAVDRVVATGQLMDA